MKSRATIKIPILILYAGELRTLLKWLRFQGYDVSWEEDGGWVYKTFMIAVTGSESQCKEAINRLVKYCEE